MQAFEQAMTLDDKKARYYDLSALVNNNENAPLSPAHFYGGAVMVLLLVSICRY